MTMASARAVGPPFASSASVHGVFGELLARNFVSPVAERALGELHDVAFVHQRHRLAALLDRIPDRHVHQPLRAELRHRLDADRGVLADLLP